MEKEVRLIDADKLKQHYAWWEIGDGEITYAEAKKRFDTIIDVQPTVDAVPTEFHDRCMEIEIRKRMDLELNSVEVVRCDDCIYRDGKTPGQPNILCWQMHADDFCSYGTKREVGTYCKDIVTVVRCKDCKYYYEQPRGFSPICELTRTRAEKEGFCAWAERKEDAKEE